MSHSAARVWTEVLVLFLGSCLVIRGIKALVDGGVLSADLLVLVALVFLYTPIVAEWWNGFRVDNDILFPSPFWPALKKALLFSGLIIAVIYVFFLPGYHYCYGSLYHWFSTDVLGMVCTYPTHPHYVEAAEGMRAHGVFTPTNTITGGILVTIVLQGLYQLLCVGFAEEFFYRGYMQTRLNGLFDPERFQLLGARFGWALPITAVLFTLGHSLVTLQWWQPFILFPALVFGWMRARTGNILAAALFHAFANTAMIVLDHVYGVPNGRLEPTGPADLLAELTAVFTWFKDLF